ncbi:MAG: hypothetical protein R3B47_19240 [Bacteroidia bacterium]
MLGLVLDKMRYSWRGKIVLYDRYYFDFIVDLKRSNISMGAALPRALYALVQAPDLNIFLYADTEVIRKRKQELDAGTISRMTAGYLHLFGDLQKASRPWQYSPIRNHDMEATILSTKKSSKIFFSHDPSHCYIFLGKKKIRLSPRPDGGRRRAVALCLDTVDGPCSEVFACYAADACPKACFWDRGSHGQPEEYSFWPHGTGA